MPPIRRATKFAYIDKYFSPHRETHGYTVHCRLCGSEDDGWPWSTRTAARKIYGRRDGQRHDSWSDVMTLWTIHMGIHHPDLPQPEWQIPEDLDPRIEEAEHRYFEISPQEKLLQEIFGEASEK